MHISEEQAKQVLAFRQEWLREVGVLMADRQSLLARLEVRQRPLSLSMPYLKLNFLAPSNTVSAATTEATYPFRSFHSYCMLT